MTYSAALLSPELTSNSYVQVEKSSDIGKELNSDDASKFVTSSDSIGQQIVAHKLLGVVAELTSKAAKNGREIGESAGLDSREVQKVLPFLAKKGRVSREKRQDAARGNYFYYWMDANQRLHFNELVERRQHHDSRTMMKKLSTLQHENERLEHELADLRIAHEALTQHCAPGSNGLMNAVSINERLEFIRSLRTRPALAPLEMLTRMEKDYQSALEIVRAQKPNS